MNSKQKSSTGFIIRISVLLLFLAVVGGAFAYDRLVLLPAGDAAVDKIVNACLDSAANKESVREAAGREPDSVETAGMHEIENYRFGRILPNLESRDVSVLYVDGKVVESFRGGISDADRRLYEGK
jgi:hypothetical protein